MLRLHPNALRRPLQRLSWLLPLALVWGCGESETKLNISVLAIDSNNQILDSVSIYSNQAMWGLTDQSGSFQETIKVQPNQRLSLSFGSPDGYVLAQHAPGLNEDGYQFISSEVTDIVIPEDSESLIEAKFVAVFEAAERDYLFMVEGDEGDSVNINGVNVTTLDASKSAHFLHTGRPDRDLTVQVGAKAYLNTFAKENEVYLITKTIQKSLRGGQPFSDFANTPQDDVELPPPNEPVAESEIDDPIEIEDPSPTPAEPVVIAEAPKKKRRARRSKRRRRAQKPAREERDEPIAFDSPRRSPPPRARPTKKASEATSVLNLGSTTRSKRSASTSTYTPPPSRRSTAPTRSAPSRTSTVPLPSASSGSRSPSPYASRSAAPSRSPAPTQPIAPSRPSAPVRATAPSRPAAPTRASAPSRPASTFSASSSSSSIAPGSPISKSAAKSKLKEIERRYDREQRLSAQDINFLKRLTAAQHGISYYYAHRLLGAFYYQVRDIRRQRDALVIATKKGRYRSDPLVLLSLAQAYGHFKQFPQALKVLRKAESKMGRLSGRDKANIYRTTAEFLRLYYTAQRSRNPLRADVSLLDKAIKKWQRLEALTGSSSTDGANARRQIAKLEKMKSKARR